MRQLSVQALVAATALIFSTGIECASAAACAEISGFYLVPFVDSPGHNINGRVAGDLQAVAAACRERQSCLGFNTDGYMKHILRPGHEWQTWTDDPCEGIYVRVEKSIEPTELTLGEGHWGDWTDWKRSDAGFFACGAQMRLQRPQGGAVFDGTAWNGLRLIFCDIQDWYHVKTVTVHPGNWGNWRSAIMCPKDEYITGGQMRIQSRKGPGGDDTAANGLRIQCTNAKSWISSPWIQINRGFEGRWRNKVWSHHQIVCGAKVRFQSPGQDGETGLNGVKFQMCIPSGVAIEGKWHYVSNNPNFEFRTSYTTTYGQSWTKSQMHSVTSSSSAALNIIGVDVGAELSAAVEYSILNTISYELSHTIEVICPSPCSADAPYMWRMEFAIKAPMAHGKLQVCSTYCTKYYIPPKCPLGSCLDENSCQKCCMDDNIIVPCSDEHFQPTSAPTESPSSYPSVSPSFAPSSAPSSEPTSSAAPTSTINPSSSPSLSPSAVPSSHPSGAPSPHPTLRPRHSPPTKGGGHDCYDECFLIKADGTFLCWSVAEMDSGQPIVLQRCDPNRRNQRFNRIRHPEYKNSHLYRLDAQPDLFVVGRDLDPSSDGTQGKLFLQELQNGAEHPVERDRHTEFLWTKESGKKLYLGIGRGRNKGCFSNKKSIPRSSGKCLLITTQLSSSPGKGTKVLPRTWARIEDSSNGPVETWTYVDV